MFVSQKSRTPPQGICFYFNTKPLTFHANDIIPATGQPHITWLLALIENFSFIPSTIFPCNTEEETALFILLNKAYSHARYKEDYSMPTELANLLKKRVHQLLLVAEKLYNKKMMTIQKNQTTTFPLAPTDTTA